MLYGYASKQVNDSGLLALSEVTIAASPETLRQIARFLLESADAFEGQPVSPQTHRHVGQVIEGWEKSCPNHDLIVIPTETQTTDNS